jgi:hypothetical protein
MQPILGIISLGVFFATLLGTLAYLVYAPFARKKRHRAGRRAGKFFAR